MQQEIELEEQAAEPVDEATKAALEVGLAQLQRGESVTLEEARRNAKEGYKAWRKPQKAALAA